MADENEIQAQPGAPAAVEGGEQQQTENRGPGRGRGNRGGGDRNRGERGGRGRRDDRRGNRDEEQ